MAKYWGLIPAAGVGQRMNTDTPKQFMTVGDRKMIEWTVRALASHQSIEGVFIGLSAESEHWELVRSIHPKVIGVFAGGDTRTETVLNGLSHMIGLNHSEEDWILVHDCNRPFLSEDEITELIHSVGDDVNGGILCQPVYDTMKHESKGRISKTLPRGELFRAQTPQMFRLGMLWQALKKSFAAGVEVTDESQAVERLGYHPRLIPGRSLNMKITTTEDLKLAEALLSIDVKS